MAARMDIGDSTLRSAKDYENLIATLYARVKKTVELIEVPPVKALTAYGNQPPGSEQFQRSIAALYGLAYTLKMGLKFTKLPRPEGYFDYKVGGLEAMWWSADGTELDINNPETLRWRAFLMVPAFITPDLVAQAVTQAQLKHPEIDYDKLQLEQLEEGLSVQALHVGPYDKERETVDRMRAFTLDQDFELAGPHHEIYISDPGRTAPEKLKTVVRYSVKRRP